MIKIDRRADARAVLDQVKSNGATGGGFDQLEQRLNEADRKPSAPRNTSAGSPPRQPNILENLKLDQAIKLAKKKSKGGSPEEAKRIYQDILTKFPENKRASDGLKALTGGLANDADVPEEPTMCQLKALVKLINQGLPEQALEQCECLIQQHERSATLFNIQGVILRNMNQHNLAVQSYNKAIALKPDFADAYNNLGNTLQEQERLHDAIVAYTKAISINGKYAEAYGNLGNTLYELGKFEEALNACSKAISLQPNFADAYYNIGNALTGLQRLDEATKAYTKALSIKPDYANADNNLGFIFQCQGKLGEARKAYTRAITKKPDYFEALRNLSALTQFTPGDPLIKRLEALLKRKDLSDIDRCNVLYTNAKIMEDLENFGAAFKSYVDGGNLRRNVLKYEFKHDQNLFQKIKTTAQNFDDLANILSFETTSCTPIFIVGMPRSGTTLIEQIISSHPTITGAGELGFVEQFGSQLVLNETLLNAKTLSKFRKQYLDEIKKRSAGRKFITDKTPQNFLFLSLICTAFPEAPIIHIKRNAQATCWSNFKQFFSSKGLGYFYRLAETASYYKLYAGLMQFWYTRYRDRIYNLDYDKLTEHQEVETRQLTEHLKLEWNAAFLSPQANRRSVNTASNLQVRQNVYQGSSQAWEKYEKYLEGIFDGLD